MTFRRTCTQLGAACACVATLGAQTPLTFPSLDGLVCTADLYLANPDKRVPFIVLFHQAVSSRGEYRDIAPRLNALGYNCLAVDARAGNRMAGVPNETALAARNARKAAGYLDARPDLIAALQYARKNHAEGPLIVWGSSYSASLALELAGRQPGMVDGVLAFSPGEYFQGGAAQLSVAEAAGRILDIPVFVTSGPGEGLSWKAIFEAIPSPRKVAYLPSETAALHGSSVLRSNLGSGDLEIRNPLAPIYWQAVEAFLKRYFAPANPLPGIKEPS